MDANMFKYILILILLLAWTNGCIYLGLDEEEDKQLQEKLLEKRRRRIEEHEKERLRSEIRKIREELDKQLSAQYKVYEKIRKRKVKHDEERKAMREKTSSLSTQNSHADVDRENFLKLHKEKENKIRFLGVKLEKLHAQARELDGELVKDAEAMERILERLKMTGERCEKVEKEKEELKIELEEMSLVLLRPVEENNETSEDMTSLDGNLTDEESGFFSADSVKFVDDSGETEEESSTCCTSISFNNQSSGDMIGVYPVDENCTDQENCTGVISEDYVECVDDSEESVDESMSCSSSFSLNDDKTTTISTFPGKCSPSTCSSKFPLQDRSPSCPSHPRISSD